MRCFDELFRFTRRVVAALALSCCAAGVAGADPGKCFRILDATDFQGRPDLASLGIERANIFEPDRWWPEGPNRDDLPDPHAALTWIRQITSKQGVLILDLERWWLHGDDAAIQEVMRRYSTVLQWIRDAGYGQSIGYYGVIPTYDRDLAMQPPGSPGYVRWSRENDHVQPLADAVDALYPSLYASDPDSSSWDKLATATLQEAKRLARGKPVMPFLSPQYEPTKTAYSKQFMSRSQWERELAVVDANADGLVLWGGSSTATGSGPAKWDESAPWWQATLAFLASHAPCTVRR